MASSVLVVDDEAPVRKFIERVLRRAGYKTATAANGVEALKVASSLDSLDLVVTDIIMPRMAGHELADRLRARQPALKVLYLTGYADNLFKEKATLGEDEAHLGKPFTIRNLLEAVAQLTP
jgi:two-component system cell cycle sensor histidine kinase/response regulator CckA